MEDAAHDSSDFAEEAALAIVKRLQLYEVCAMEWLQVAKDISELALLSDREVATTPETAFDLTKRLGRGTKDTLWDTATQASVQRSLVNENKVNLLVLLVKQFKDWERQDQLDIRIQRTADRLQLHKEHLLQELFFFEANIGRLLTRVFAFLEGLQQANLQNLCEHVVCIIGKLVVSPGPYDERLQEGQVFTYIEAIFLNSGHLASEEMLMNWLEHHKTFSNIVHFLITQQANLQQPFLIKILRALAAAAVTDKFNDDFKKYFPDTQLKQAFLAFRNSSIRSLIVEEPALRENLRTLLEATDQLEREVRLKDRSSRK
jgi:hypothetical protein